MDDLHARPYRADDAPAVAELINIVAEAGGWYAGHVAAEIDEVLYAVRDPETDTRVVAEPSGRLVAVGLVPLPPDGGHRVDLIGGVHPDRRGSGLGRELLAWQFDRAAARHAEVAPDAPWQAEVFAGLADRTAIRLYERLGFTVARYYLDMTAPTTPPPTATTVEGLRIMPYDPGQERTLYAVHSAAFGSLPGYQDRALEPWAALTVRSDTFRPELSRLALADDELVGYVLSYSSGIPGRFYIGQVGTAEAWRGRGVATALLADLLTEAGRNGYTHASLDTQADNPSGAAGVYAKVGFEIDHRVVAYHKPVQT
jgi:ribosomal protein S18 acetylase RimI-like enzyme